MAKTLNFKNKEAYHKWLAYDKMHHKGGSGSKPAVKIAGKSHKVDRGK